MAKPKTKRSVMDTLATKTGTFGHERWEWETKMGQRVLKWFWKEGFTGMNTGTFFDGEEKPLLFAKNLDLAVMYSWGHEFGFTEGWNAGARVGMDTEPAQ